jgi:hypothetical protein
LVGGYKESISALRGDGMNYGAIQNPAEEWCPTDSQSLTSLRIFYCQIIWGVALIPLFYSILYETPAEKGVAARSIGCAWD